MQKLYFPLWGVVSLHTLLLLTCLLFPYLLPTTGALVFESGWVVFLFVVLFAANLFLTLLAGFWLNGASFLDEHTFGLIPLALLGFVFVPLTTNNWLYHRQYETAPLLHLDARAPSPPARFALYDLTKDTLLRPYLLRRAVKHTYTPTKSNQIRTYYVPCEVVPFVPRAWSSKEKISLFLAREGDKLRQLFPLNGYVGKLVEPRHQANYGQIVKYDTAYRKAGINIAASPLFLTPVNRASESESGWKWARFFYLLMLGGWGTVSIMIFFQKSE